MCNIAGYVGENRAAPILLDMISREEGFGAGYYTGIATLFEGKIYYAKLTGDSDRLIANTDAAKLPGNIGIIHGRSGPICGDDKWAHPFISIRDGEIKTAYVANGSIGCFKNRTAEYGLLADKLQNEGYTYLSKLQFDGDIYNKLSDGTTAHMSDVMCQLIFRNLEKGSDAASAMTDAFCEMPSEIVGLMLSLSDPDSIVYSRINQPMFLSFSSHGAYLATSAIAFPSDAGEPQLLPPLTSGYVTKRGLQVIPYEAPPATVAPITSEVTAKAYNAVLGVLEKGETSLYNAVSGYDLSHIALPFFEKADCAPDTALVYEILYSLHKEGRLCINKRKVPTSVEGLDATFFTMNLK